MEVANSAYSVGTPASGGVGPGELRAASIFQVPSCQTSDTVSVRQDWWGSTVDRPPTMPTRHKETVAALRWKPSIR